MKDSEGLEPQRSKGRVLLEKRGRSDGEGIRRREEEGGRERRSKEGR